MSKILRKATTQVFAIEACGSFRTLSAMGAWTSLGKFILLQVVNTGGS
jgi:hypothetical protein